MQASVARGPQHRRAPETSHGRRTRLNRGEEQEALVAGDSERAIMAAVFAVSGEASTRLTVKLCIRSPENLLKWLMRGAIAGRVQGLGVAVMALAGRYHECGRRAAGVPYATHSLWGAGGCID